MIIWLIFLNGRVCPNVDLRMKVNRHVLKRDWKTVNKIGKSYITNNNRENLHFDNEWDIHISSKYYDENELQPWFEFLCQLVLVVIFNIWWGTSVHFRPTYLSELGMILMIKTNLYTPKFIPITSHHIISQHGGFNSLQFACCWCSEELWRLMFMVIPNPKTVTICSWELLRALTTCNELKPTRCKGVKGLEFNV